MRPTRLLILIITVIMLSGIIPMTASAEGSYTVIQTALICTAEHEHTEACRRPLCVTVSDSAGLLAAMSDVVPGGEITLKAGIYNLESVEPDKALTLCGEDGAIIVFAPETDRNITGATNGFKFTKPFSGQFTLSNLTINGSGNNLALIWLSNTSPEGMKLSLENCRLNNPRQSDAAYSHAVSFEYKNGPAEYYFDLAVKNCYVNATSYGIGSGLDNGNPDVSRCSLTVSGTVFDSTGDRNGIYNIHAPKPFAVLDVQDSEFKGAGGGIKYIYNETNTVRINSNQFLLKERQGDFTGSSSYAIMATVSGWNYATEMKGNNLKGQNCIAAVLKDMEVIWFPDGQAVNSPRLNNNGDCNTTDAGSRYTHSVWGTNRSIAVLTDFNIISGQMSFTVGDSAQTTGYYFNTLSSSGAYTNYTDYDAQYFTQDNPRHVVNTGARGGVTYITLADFEKANAVTRWNLDGIPFEYSDADNGFSAETDAVKVIIDKTRGIITVIPKAVGSAVLTAVVGGGEDSTDGTDHIGNAKTDRLCITVKEKNPDEDPSDTSDTGALPYLAVSAAALLCCAPHILQKHRSKNVA